MNAIPLETLLREVRTRGIRITSYVIDYEAAANNAWNRRRYAILARAAMIQEHRRQWALWQIAHAARKG